MKKELETKVTIVMYHYVRDFARSKYPNIKGLEIKSFRGQIEFLSKHYNFISIEELISAYHYYTELPPYPVLLTFDDGYSDHYDFVFPLLKEMDIKAAFYPPVKSIESNIVLNVNKIHFILALERNTGLIIKSIFELLDHYRKDYELRTNDYYFRKLAHPNRFDKGEIIFIKRLLQAELPKELRDIICSALFKKFVSLDEIEFSKELYMNKDQLKELVRAGMHIGSHGNSHQWLSTLSKNVQEAEITSSLKFLEEIGCDTTNLTMCYPFGDYNLDTIDILKELECKLAFTTNVGVASLNKSQVLEIPRLDTNDLPNNMNASPNKWYTH